MSEIFPSLSMKRKPFRILRNSVSDMTFFEYRKSVHFIRRNTQWQSVVVDVTLFRTLRIFLK